MDVGPVGATDDFFELGGDSILAARTLGRVRDELGIRLTLRDVFTARTVAALAPLLDQQHTAALPEPIPAAPRGVPLPLSHAQRRLWFLDDLSAGGSEYNTGVALRLHGAVDPEACRRALHRLAARHDSLRTTFGTVDGQGVQRIAAEGVLPLRTADLGDLPADQRAEAAEALLTEELDRPYELTVGPLTRALLVRLADEEHLLLLGQHHIVTDGWSVGVLTRELAALYHAEATAGPDPLPAPAVQYPDFAVWEQGRRAAGDGPGEAEDLGYWKRQLSGLPQLRLPTDRPRPALRTTFGAAHRHLLPPELVARLRHLATGRGTTLFALLAGASALLFSRYSGQRDVVFGTVTNGRDRPELEQVTGFFANTVVLRGDVDESATVDRFVESMGATVLDAFVHAGLPFDRVVEELAPPRNPGRTPLVQVMVVQQTAAVALPQAGGLRFEEHPLPRPAARFDLVLEFAPDSAGGCALTVEYNTDLFDPRTVAGMSGHLRRLLEGMADGPQRTLAELPMLADDEQRPVYVGPVEPEPVPAVRVVRHVPPRTPTERILAAILADVLQVERVGADDNFFQLGGDSILSIQVVARARQADLRVTSRDVYQHQTVAALARCVDDAGRPQLAVPAAAVAATGPSPLTAIQRWWFDRAAEQAGHFAQTLSVLLPEDLDPAALEAALNDVVDHHDALRSGFLAEDAGVRWHIGEQAPRIVLARHSGPDTDTPHFGPFELSQGPLLRAVLHDRGPGRPRVLHLAVHHLVVDGVSWRVLLEDLDRAYRARRVGGDGARALLAKSSPLRQWALRLDAHAADGGFDDEREYWSRAVPDCADPLPADLAGADTYASARSVTVRLSPADTSVLLRTLPDTYRTQVNDVLLSALGRALSGVSGQDEVLVDVEGHGREELFADLDLSRTVGWFTTRHPVALAVPAQAGWDAVLKQVKEQLRAVPRHGLGYDVLRHPAEPGTFSGPHVQISFNYLGRMAFPDGPDGLFRGEFRPLELDADPAGRRPHALELVGRLDGDSLEFTLFYSDRVHRASTVEALAERFAEALADLARHAARPGAGGRTPSDFPLVRLDQAAVDRIVGDQPAAVEDVLPLTPTQAGMLFHGLSQEDSGVYFQQLTFLLEGVPTRTRWPRPGSG
ncbi:condensation domain-containing protein [Streptacidiphilus sp. PAMC 29251]